MIYEKLFGLVALIILGVLGLASVLLILDLVGLSPF